MALDKFIVIMIFMYAASFSMLSVQYMLADVFGITMTAPDGTPIRNPIITMIHTDTLNTITSNIVGANSTQGNLVTGIERAFAIGFYLGLEIFQLATGTYIFNILYLFGVPPIVIAGLVVLFVIILGVEIIARIRG